VLCVSGVSRVCAKSMVCFLCPLCAVYDVCLCRVSVCVCVSCVSVCSMCAWCVCMCVCVFVCVCVYVCVCKHSSLHNRLPIP